jgi:hypothetical protein
MAASDLYSDAISALTTARATMLSPEWQASIDAGSAEQRLTASQQLIQIQQTILALSNASLNDIANAMQQNAVALTSATSALKSALADITKVGNVINAASSLVAVIAKIVPLL